MGGGPDARRLFNRTTRTSGLLRAGNRTLRTGVDGRIILFLRGRAPGREFLQSERPAGVRSCHFSCNALSRSEHHFIFVQTFMALSNRRNACNSCWRRAPGAGKPVTTLLFTTTPHATARRNCFSCPSDAFGTYEGSRIRRSMTVDIVSVAATSIRP